MIRFSVPANKVPPFRERAEDIFALVEYFLECSVRLEILERALVRETGGPSWPDRLFPVSPIRPMRFPWEPERSE